MSLYINTTEDVRKHTAKLHANTLNLVALFGDELTIYWTQQYADPLLTTEREDAFRRAVACPYGNLNCQVHCKGISFSDTRKAIISNRVDPQDVTMDSEMRGQTSL